MSDTQVWFVLICGACGIFGLGGGWLAFVAYLRWTEWRSRAEDRATRLRLIEKNGGSLGGALLTGSDAADATRERLLDERAAKVASVQRGRRDTL